MSDIDIDKRLDLTRNDSMTKWLKDNWKYWDEDCMHLEKIQKGNVLFVAVDSTIIRVAFNRYISEKQIRLQLMDVENNRKFKLKNFKEYGES
jgi:hypothetical protein